MHQLTLTFESASPINKEKLGKQNKTVFEMLERGSITCYDAILVGIFNLHSRISDLRNKHGIIIYDRFVSRNGSTVKEYSLTPFE